MGIIELHLEKPAYKRVETNESDEGSGSRLLGLFGVLLVVAVTAFTLRKLREA